MDKVQCVTCGAMILPETAEKNSGRCAPCKKQADVPSKIAPARLAFVLAALVLFANAANSALQIATHKGMAPLVVAVAIDVALGVFLLRLDERARFFTVVRAVGGLLLVGVGVLFKYSGLELILALVGQVSLSSSLILLLAWETVRWRMVSASGMAILYFAYLLLAVFGTFYVQNT